MRQIDGSVLPADLLQEVIVAGCAMGAPLSQVVAVLRLKPARVRKLALAGGVELEGIQLIRRQRHEADCRVALAAVMAERGMAQLMRQDVPALAAALADQGFRPGVIATVLRRTDAAIIQAAKRYGSLSSEERGFAMALRDAGMEEACRIELLRLALEAFRAAELPLPEGDEMDLDEDEEDDDEEDLAPIPCVAYAPWPVRVGRVASPAWRPSLDLAILKCCVKGVLKYERIGVGVLRGKSCQGITARWHRLRMVPGLQEALEIQLAERGDLYEVRA
ncbi:hypothetical protein FGG78_20155 [Thioclava sp. BHET1]|nr:hypothetical protein FGG78_20155 [Thioclava sp. BHET1]